MEILKCGPCKKCRLRAEKLASISLSPEQSEVVARKVTTRQKHQKTALSDCTICQYSSAALQTAQLKDPDISPVLQWKVKNERPKKEDATCFSTTTRHYLSLWDQLVVKNDVLYKCITTTLGEIMEQLIVPKCMKKEILNMCHCSLLSGHLGIKKTKFRVTRHFYWFEMKEEVRIFIKSCENCSMNKPPIQKPKALLGKMSYGAPWECFATDFIGPLPVTNRGNRYILVVMDYFTKWAEAFPVPDQTAVATANVLLNEITRYGCPLIIHSNQGRNYESCIFKELCSLLHIKKTRTTARNPKCNGMVERFNRTLIRMIKAFIVDDHEEWDFHLNCLTSAYRSTCHESTSLTPNLLIFGREIQMPYEASHHSLASNGEEISSYGDFVEEIRSKLYHAHEIARKHLYKSTKRQRDIYNSKVLIHKYAAGDIVWLLNEKVKDGECPKLRKAYAGPFVVLKVFSDLVLEIQLDVCGECKIVNHNKLLPYNGCMPPKWALKLSEKLKNKT